METRKSLFLLPTLLLAGCDNTWVAKRIGDTALGSVTIGVYEFATNKPCRDGARRVYISRVDDYGRNEVDSEQMWIDCDQPGVYNSRADARRVAEAYNINERASYLLLKLLKDAKAGSVAAFFEAGFSQEDVERIAVYELPTNEGLEALSIKWNLETKVLKRVFKKIFKDARKLDKQQVLAEERALKRR